MYLAKHTKSRVGFGQRILSTLPVTALIMLMVALLVRAQSFFPSIIDPDEGLYIVQAREWLRGGWPYVAVWDMHPPGAPVLLSAAIGLFGETIFAARLLSTIAVAATGTLLAWLVRRTGGGQILGLAAGLLYTAYSLLLGGMSTNTELLFAPFIVFAMAISAGAANRALSDSVAVPVRWRDILGAGAAIGIALTIKPVAVAEGSLAFFVLVGFAWWNNKLTFRQVLYFAVGYALICAAPTVLFAAAYAFNGNLNAYIDANILAPFRYVSEEAPADGRAAWRQIVAAILRLSPLFVLGLIALITLVRRQSEHGLLCAVSMIWLVAATLAVAAPMKFFAHYFQIWLPPLTLLAVLGIQTLARLVQPWAARSAFIGLSLVAGSVPIISTLVPMVEEGFGIKQPDAARKVANAMVAELGQSGGTAYVVNYHVITYFLSKTTPPTRFAFPSHLVGYYDHLTGVDTEAELKRILDTRPGVIVVDRGRWSSMRPGPASIINEVLNKHYEIKNSVPDVSGLVEIWGLSRG